MNKIIVLFFLGIGFAVLILLLLFYLNRKQANPSLGTGNRVIATMPQDGSKNISADTQLTIQFANPIQNSTEVQLQFTPALPFGKYGIVSALPSKTFTIKPTGILMNNTQYQVAVFYKGTAIYHFSFTTITKVQTQTDPEAIQQANDFAKQYYPLSQQMPYDSATISADYDAPHEIKVIIKQGTQEQAQQEIEAFMQRYGDNTSIDHLVFTHQ